MALGRADQMYHDRVNSRTTHDVVRCSFTRIIRVANQSNKALVFLVFMDGLIDRYLQRLQVSLASMHNCSPEFVSFAFREIKKHRPD